MKPSWLKTRIPSGESYDKIADLISRTRTHTICQEALCPNRAECWGKGTAAFLILGDICTRNCGYCNVKHGIPSEVDLDEPRRVANLVKELGLNYVVITSVTRDDLRDGGAQMFANTIIEIKRNTNAKVEVLIPDFRNEEELKKVINAKPDVIGHNIEVSEALFPAIRPRADYNKSLKLLRMIKEIKPEQATKSSLMIGFGEAKEDIIKTMHALRKAKVDIFYIGQYLQPSKRHAEVVKYYSPLEFKEIENIGYRLGFSSVKAGPLVRSSYMAGE